MWCFDMKFCLLILSFTLTMGNFKVNANAIAKNESTAKGHTRLDEFSNGTLRKKRDFFDDLFAIFDYEYDDDESDESDEKYLICRNCTVIVNKQDDKENQISSSTITVSTTIAPIYSSPTNPTSTEATTKAPAVAPAVTPPVAPPVTPAVAPAVAPTVAPTVAPADASVDATENPTTVAPAVDSADAQKPPADE